MSRTYQTQAQYDTACERLAAHLNTLTTDQISLACADGTQDADGTWWIPASAHLLEPAAQASWFMEKAGAAARFDGSTWHAAEPGPDELTGSALAAWGEDSDDLGYPVARTP